MFNDVICSIPISLTRQQMFIKHMYASFNVFSCVIYRSRDIVRCTSAIIGIPTPGCKIDKR